MPLPQLFLVRGVACRLVAFIVISTSNRILQVGSVGRASVFALQVPDTDPPSRIVANPFFPEHDCLRIQTERCRSLGALIRPWLPFYSSLRTSL